MLRPSPPRPCRRAFPCQSPFSALRNAYPRSRHVHLAVTALSGPRPGYPTFTGSGSLRRPLQGPFDGLTGSDLGRCSTVSATMDFHALAPARRGWQWCGQKKLAPPWSPRTSPPNAASERGDRGVQRRTRPHRRRYLGRIGQVVTAYVHRLALRGDQFGIDPGLVGRERLGQLLEAGLQHCALALRGQRLRPVECQVEMAATIVDFADPVRGRAVEFEDLAV